MNPNAIAATTEIPIATSNATTALIRPRALNISLESGMRRLSVIDVAGGKAPPDNKTLSPILHFAIRTTDVDGAIARARAAGFQVTTEPKDVTIPARPQPLARRRPSTLLDAMAKVCHSCGKKPAFGQSRSHSMVATKRRFNPNLQKVRVLIAGAPRRVYVCTRCLKAGKVTKAA